MEKEGNKFIIFAHSGTYDKLYEIATLALTAAAMGREVYIFLFFWALKKFASDVDAIDFPSEYYGFGRTVGELMKEKKIPSISEMIKDAKSIGSVKIIACSASMEFMDVRSESLNALIDDVWGLPMILNTIQGADTQLFI